MNDIFSLKDFKMPEDFLWGSSAAGHQIEGNNIHSDRWASELIKEKTEEDFQASGMACNHYELYRKDIDMMSELGHQAFRTSMEWSRIEPECGRFDEKELMHYIDEFAYLKSKGIKLFLTLVHFSVPKWFSDLGGFENIENLKYFERYLEYVLPKISEYVDFWNTLNETNHPRISSHLKRNYLKFHARGNTVIKKYSKAPVSIAHAFHLYMPKRMYDKFDTVRAEYYDNMVNEYFLHAIRTGEIVLPDIESEYCEEVKNSCDFWSINWYTRDLIDARSLDGISSKYNHTEMLMIPRCRYFDEFFAEGMTAVMMRLRDKPVYITENGCCTEDDRFRIVYVAQVLSALKDAIDFGVDVKGYLYWSLMDNYEWYSFKPQFGIVSVDFETFERTPKPSAYFYKDIIDNNGFTQEILRKYLSEAPRLN